jgi:hypothetical protein
MRTFQALVIAAALSLAGLAGATPAPSVRFVPPTEDLVYGLGGQFSARLDQTRNRWRLQPLNGEDVVIDAGTCATGSVVPTGVLLLVVDRRGRAELVAPSTTRLPAGSPDRIALRACDQASGRALAVPQSVLDLLVANSSAIYVSR